MPSLLLVVFVVQLVIYLINTIGAPVINDFLWTLYTRLPGNPIAKDGRKQRELQREVLKLKQDMTATSSQDEFAKWAKIRRNHDKKLAEYDEKSSRLKAFKTKFDSFATIVRTLSTIGLRFFLQFWYARSPIFWIPRGWVPSYVEWVLSFPRAPIGSVSIQIWGIACASVIGMVGSAVVAGLVLVREEGTGTRMGTRREGMKMKKGEGGGGEKKEL